MSRLIACILSTFCILFQVAALGFAQQEAGEGKRLDRQAWTAAFLTRMKTLDPAAEAAKDPELIRLVTAYTWHAVPQAIKWLDATDPEVERKKGESVEVLLGRARLIAQVMKEHRKAPGLEEIIERVGEWTAEEWTKYRETAKEYQNADALFKGHDWADAESKYVAAARTYRRLGRWDRLAAVSYLAGRCSCIRSRFSRSKACFMSTLALEEKIGNERRLATSLMGLGHISRSLGRFEDAISYYRRALALDEKTGNETELVASLTGLGNVSFSLGRHEDALDFFRHALAIEEKTGNETRLAATLTGLGNVSQSLGRYEEARKYHHRALALREKTGNEIDMATSLNNLGVVSYSLGRYEETLGFYRRALVLWKKSGNEAYIAVSLSNLGGVCYVLGRYEEALGYQRRALALQEKIGNAAEIARSLNNLGSVSNSLGRHEDARRYYRRALTIQEKIGNINDIATTLAGLGAVSGLLSRYEEARGYYQRALTIQEKTGNENDIATSLAGLGVVSRLLGRYEEALGYYQRALPIQEKIGNAAHIAMSLAGVGNVYASLGRYEEALGFQHRALALHEKIGNIDHIAESLNNLGVVTGSLGRYEEALRYHHRAQAIFKKAGNEAKIASSLSNMGIIYDSLGRYEKAFGYYRRALALKKKIGNEADIAGSLTGLGNVSESLGRYEEALEYHRRALALQIKIGNESSIATSLGGLGNASRMLRRYEEALVYHRRALVYWKKTGDLDGIARSLNNLGTCFHSMGRYEEALVYHQRALAFLEKTGNEDYIAVSLNNAGSTLCRLGKVREAREHFARALDKVRGVRESLLADPDRVAFMDRWHGSLAHALEAALEEKAPEIVPDCPLALRVVETLRGMATADLLQASLRGERLLESGPAAAAVERIEGELEALERRVRKTYEGGGKDSATADTRRADLRARQRALEKKWQVAVDNLRRSSPEWANLKRPEAIGLEAFCALLPKKTAFLAFVMGKEESFLLLVDREGLRHWRLPGKETIEKAVKHHLDLLSEAPGPDAPTGGVVESGRRLHALLLGPAGDALRRYEALLVSAEGILWGLPLETLVTGGEGTDVRTASYLVHQHAIAYVHSATVWGIHWRRGQTRRKAYEAGQEGRPTGMRVLADPIMPGEAGWAGKPLQLLISAKRSEPAGRLPFTRAEGLAVATGMEGLEQGSWRLTVDGKGVDAGAFRARLERLRSAGGERDVVLEGPGLELLVGRPATREALAGEKLGGVRFLHLATHAHLDAESPGLSGMWLSPRDEEDSGFLRLADVMNLRLRAEVVTLSGCETALGKKTVSEGYQGLVRAFLFAGAENVVASAWRVDDAASADVLSGLYRSLREGRSSAAVVVQEVKRKYLERVPESTPEKVHPYYWGAWMLWGTGVGYER